MSAVQVPGAVERPSSAIVFLIANTGPAHARHPKTRLCKGKEVAADPVTLKAPMWVGNEEEVAFNMYGDADDGNGRCRLWLEWEDDDCAPKTTRGRWSTAKIEL